jgi:hypothetical protein
LISLRKKKIFEFPFQFSISACRFNDDEIMVASYKGKLSRISISQHKIIKEYPLTYAVGGKLVNSSIGSIRQAPNGEIVIQAAEAVLCLTRLKN